MTNSSRSSVYANGRIDFLQAVNVQSKIIGKNNWLVHLYLAFCTVNSWKLEQR